MPTVLITGANRGIGLEHVRQYLRQGWRIHACARDLAAASELQALARSSELLQLHELDVTDHAAVDALAAKLLAEPLDVLLNNAGTFGPQGAPDGMAYQSLESMDYVIWREILEVNLLGAFKVATAFRAHLENAERGLLINMSSGLASIADNHGSSYAYRSSKAGLNIMSKGMAAEWPNIIVIAMAPGWCKTDLGGPDAPVDVADSVREQQALYEAISRADSGKYMDATGVELKW